MALIKKTTDQMEQSSTTQGNTSTEGGSSYTKPTPEQYTAWGVHQWDALKVSEVNKGDGKFEKKITVIGTLNFLMELGFQPDNFMQMKSNINAPTGSAVNSPEELERIKSFPSNEFYWDISYKDGKEIKERKVRWPIFPESEIVLAIDFPSIKLNYALHPYSKSEEGVEDINECRIDYNGRWNGAFNRKINNSVNYKTKRLSDKSIQYQIATACGNLEEYIKDGHQLADLAGVVCNWTIKMTKKIQGDKVFYSDLEISAPTAVQDIQERSGVFTVAEQLAVNKSEQEVCGIQLNGGSYSVEELKQVRFMWWKKVMKAVMFDKNEGSNRTGEWLEGANWADSDLCKACIELGIELPHSKGEQQSNAVSEPVNQSIKEPVKKTTELKAIEVIGEDFEGDDLVPF